MRLSIVCDSNSQLPFFFDKQSFSSLAFAFTCRSLVKNMLMSYFNTPEKKRAEVVRVLGALLGFTHEELDKVKLKGERSSKSLGLISGFNT